MVEKRQVEIDAVDTEQLANLLEILSIKKGFENKEYHCEVCGTVMTYDNVKFIFPKQDMRVGFVCKTATCVVNFALKEELDTEKNANTE